MTETKEEEKIEVKEEKATPVKIFLTQEQEVDMFKSLIKKTYKQVGYDKGIHLMFPNDDAKVVGFVASLVGRIKRAPQLWGLSQDTVDVIQEALDSRSIKKNPALKSDLNLQEESFRDKLDGMRDTVAEIINKKLAKYNTTKGIDNIQIRDLKDLLAMAIDKGRLLRGESTENITKMAKIDTDQLTPEEALKVIMKARDMLIEGKK